MFSMLVKEKLTVEQEIEIFNEFEEFMPHRFEYNVDGFYAKVSVFAGNQYRAQQLCQNFARKATFKFVPQFQYYFPLFHPEFVKSEEKDPEFAHLEEENQKRLEISENPPHLEEQESFTPPPETPRAVEHPEYKPIIRTHQVHVSSPAPAPPQLSPLPSNYVTFDQFEKFTEQMNQHVRRMSELARQNAIAAASTPVLAPTSSGSSGVPPAAPITKQTAPTPQFLAKNELIANGITCKKCQLVIKNISPIGNLISAVRDHVIYHFDAENPLLKRYECRECSPNFRTNFVDDLEKHLKQHGSMIPLPQRRQKLVLPLLAPTHLQLICALSNSCYPEVFEKNPPQFETIPPIETPVKAKMSVFPPLDRSFSMKFNIPSHCNKRVSSQPITLD